MKTTNNLPKKIKKNKKNIIRQVFELTKTVPCVRVCEERKERRVVTVKCFRCIELSKNSPRVIFYSFLFL